MSKGMASFVFVFLIVTISAPGCLPSTTIKKDPGKWDRGVRYYRPKPYLMLKPMIANDAPVSGYVTIEQVIMPDFSEEYSIHVRTGLGTNATAITLDQGWNLTNLNVTLDSQFDENLNAAAEIIKAVPTAGGGQGLRMDVKATNVPMGLYEAVLSEGPDGKKRLYGFRYVGFMPYSPCPLESCGVEHQTCCDGMVYGLVFENGAMVFRPLLETPHAVDATPIRVGLEPKPSSEVPGPKPIEGPQQAEVIGGVPQPSEILPAVPNASN